MSLQLLDPRQQKPDLTPSILNETLAVEQGGNLANSTIQHASDVVMWVWLFSEIRRAPFKAPSRRQLELQWRRTHKEVLRGYLGQWVVLQGERILASGPSLAEAVKQAREMGVRVPYVFRVEDLDENIATIGL